MSLQEQELFITNTDTVKGIIVDKDGNIVVNNFPKPLELVYPQNIYTPMKVYEAIEATMIRVYFYKDKWYISTTSRIDASSSFWGEKTSFRTLFEEELKLSGITLDNFLKKLDTRYKYFFMLPTKGYNRIGIKNNIDGIVFTGLEKESGELLYGDLKEYGKELPVLYQKVYNIKSEDDITRLQNSLSVGVVIYKTLEDGTLSITKLLTQQYKRYIDARKNEPNLGVCYIDCIKNKDTESLLLLKEIHSRFNFEKRYEYPLNKYVSYIHSKYIDRYIHKHYIVVPKEDYYLMKQCHNLYLEKRTPTTPETILDLLLQQHPKVILKRIRNFN